MVTKRKLGNPLTFRVLSQSNLYLTPQGNTNNILISGYNNLYPMNKMSVKGSFVEMFCLRCFIKLVELSLPHFISWLSELLARCDRLDAVLDFLSWTSVSVVLFHRESTGWSNTNILKYFKMLDATKTNTKLILNANENGFQFGFYSVLKLNWKFFIVLV